MAFTNSWDDTFPPDTQAANQLGADLRNFRVDTRERMSAMSGADAAKPTFESGFVGVLYFATDTGKIYRWNGSSWVDVTSLIIAAVTPTSLGLAAVATSGNYNDMKGITGLINSVTNVSVSGGTATGNYIIVRFGSDFSAGNPTKYFEFAFGTGEAKQGDTIPLPPSFSSSNALANAFYKRSTESAGNGLDNVVINLSGLVVTDCYSDRVSDGNQTAATWCGWWCICWRQV